MNIGRHPSVPITCIHQLEGAMARRGLKGFLDDHPLPSLLGLCVSVATVVAGVMTYYTSQRLDAAETRHKAELIGLAAKNKADLLDATNPLKQTIADLTFRISSIERRVPGTGPVYLDVATVSVGPETIKALSSKYRSFDGGDFYIAPPEMGNWSYHETTEFDFISSIYSFFGPEMRAQLQGLGESKLHLWRGKSETKFQVKATSLGDITFTFFPALTVQKITPEFIRTRMAGMQDMMEGKATSLKEIAKAVDQLNKEIRLDDEHKEKVVNDESAVGAEQAVQAAAEKQELVEKLSSAYSVDSGSFILVDFLMSATMQSMQFGAEHRIYSAQKKGNVLYLQDRVTFRKARIYDGDKLSAAGERNIAVDQEIFFFGSGADGYLVKVYLPPVPDRADAFSWIKSWLSGLQIPLG
jgi:hypothetical protein